MFLKTPKTDGLIAKSYHFTWHSTQKIGRLRMLFPASLSAIIDKRAEK